MNVLMNFKRLKFGQLIKKCHSFNSKRFFSIISIYRRSGRTTIYSSNELGDRHLFKSFKSNSISLRCLSTKPQQSVDYKTENRKSVQKTLIKSFGLQLEEIETIFKNYPNFNQISVNSLQNKIAFLEEKQLSSAELATKRCWVLLTDKLSLSFGIRLLENNDLLDNIRDGKTYIFSLFLGDRTSFTPLCKRIKRSDSTLFSDIDERMDFFCHNLDLNKLQFCSIVRQNFVLMTKDLNHFKSIMKLLKDNGVPNEDIIKDFWIFNHNIRTMEKRIEECKRINRPIKTWCLRSPDKVWYPLVDRWKQNRDSLGEDNDRRSFLKKILKCTDDDINNLLFKNSRLLEISPKKLDQMTELIYRLGYTSSDIMRVPRVLNYGFERVRKRLTDQTLTIGTEKPDLEVIFLSEEHYKKLIESMTTQPNHSPQSRRLSAKS